MVSAIFSSGSSTKFCLLAEGNADIYPRLGPTMEWDTAAGHFLVKSLRGDVLSVDTCEELRYNKEILINPGFIALAGRASDKNILNLLER